MNNLTVLADRGIGNHKNLFLAEAAAWLHDFKKCTDEHIERWSLENGSSQIVISDRRDYLQLVEPYQVMLLSDSASFKELVRSNSRDRRKWLVRILVHCHNVAHIEKEDVFFYLQKQPAANTRSSSSFGYESQPLRGLSQSLEHIPYGKIGNLEQFENRSDFREALTDAFRNVPADTEHPINEVTLWDWSDVVAALYKAVLAGCILRNAQQEPIQIFWNLLSIRLDGFAFIGQAVRISDLLARQKLLNGALDKVRELFEVTYPFGTEIYRDMNGSTFIVPVLGEAPNDLEDLLSLEDGTGTTLKMLIESEFGRGTINEDNYLQLGKEAVPFIKYDKMECWTRRNPQTHQGPHTYQKPLPIVTHLEEKRKAHPDAEAVRDWWQNHREDVCTVCLVRPQGWGIDNETHYDNRARGKKCSSNCQTCKALARRVCTVCEQRREDRSKRWATEEPHKTIWIDEVSDKYGRIALVVGKFDLGPWLDGKVLFYPNIRRHLFIESLNVSVVIQKIEKLWAGGYQMVLDTVPSGVAADDSCSIHGQQFQFKIINVGRNEWGIETASDAAIKFVEEQIIHPGRGVDEKHFQPIEIVHTDTPARLYRVWETTRGFWKGIEEHFEKTIRKTDLRLRIQGAFDQDKSATEDLGDYHTYELKLGHVNLSVVHVGGNKFITADNLERVAFLLNPAEKLSGKYRDAAERVFDRLVEENNREKIGVQLEAPTGYGNPAKVLGRLHLFDSLKFEEALDETAYVPAVPILADPETFMAIVPASKALDVVRGIKDDTIDDSKKQQLGIKEQYEEQMGKVRNRLPITVGVVFAGRRTPLPAILDAGRRMLEQQAFDEDLDQDEDWGEEWEVMSIDPPLPRNTWSSQVTLTLHKVKDSGEEAEGSSADGGDTGDLKQEQQSLTITVPTVMGDKTTLDEWFPYWRMKSPVAGSWVHVCDLHADDIVYFTPSRFDFEFLETAAQRFEISYEENKRRGSKHPRRPYYIEELDEIDELWKILSRKEGLTTTQIHNLIENIEGTRLEWQGYWDQEVQKVFDRLVRDALKEAGWKDKEYPRRGSAEFDKLHRAAVSGQLADVVELHMRILKEKPKRDQEEEK